MIFGGVQRTTTIDFPGVLACVLFTRGCDADCFYCHNRDLLARAGQALEEAEVFRFLERRRGLLDGVVVSGGEPTLQPDLERFLARLREWGYRIKLDTNGRRPDLVGALMERGLVDYLAVDVKALPGDYPAVCGLEGFSAAAETLARAAERGLAREARTTLYPGMTLDALEELLGLLPPMPRWRLNYFRMPERFRPEDAARLALPAPTPGRVKERLPRLLALQPNLIYE